MINNETVVSEFVPKELFDIHIQNIRDKAASDEKFTDARFQALEKLLDERFNRLQAVVEKNLAEHKAVAAKTDAEISNIRGDVKTLNERIEHAIDTLSIAISNNNQRLDDLRDEIAKKQSFSFAKWGIYTALFIGAVQVFISVILHFWF